MRLLALPVAVLCAAVVVPNAAAIGLPEVPVPNTDEPCNPRPTRLCFSAQGSTEALGKQLAGLTSSPKLRRGLALPPAKRLFGRKAKKLLKKSDRRFAAKLGGPLEARAGAAASPRIRRGLSVSSSVRRGRSAHRRSMLFEVGVESCPTTGSPASSHGVIDVQGRALFRVQNIARYGRKYVYETIEINFAFNPKGLVSHHADYVGFRPGHEDPMNVTRSYSVYDPRTGRSNDLPTARVEFDVRALDPEGIRVDFTANGFDRYIERMIAQERGEPGPEPPETLAGNSYLRVVRQFTQWVATRIREVVNKAERNWRTPNRCVKLTLDGTPKLAPSGVANVTGKLAHVGGAGVDAGLYGEYVHFDGNYINGGTTEVLAKLPLDQSEPWYAYTAPPDPWPDSARPGLDITATTKGGIGKASITFELEEANLYYKVLGAKYHEDVVADGPIEGSVCHTEGVDTGIHQVSNINIGAQPYDGSNRIEMADDGSMFGSLSASGTGTISGTVDGCDHDSDPQFQPCTTPFSGDFTAGPAAFVEVARGAQTATLKWPLPQTQRPTTPGQDPSCMPDILGGDDPDPMPSEQVPLATLRQTSPFTLTFTKTRNPLTPPGVSWGSTVNYSMTLQRVREDGSPL
jgi:hypothetical protein